eukprot:COSAG02_NODE_6041_length_3849_cov_2.330933_1_plen_720_part_10
MESSIALKLKALRKAVQYELDPTFIYYVCDSKYPHIIAYVTVNQILFKDNKAKRAIQHSFLSNETRVNKKVIKDTQAIKNEINTMIGIIDLFIKDDLNIQQKKRTDPIKIDKETYPEIWSIHPNIAIHYLSMDRSHPAASESKKLSPVMLEKIVGGIGSSSMSVLSAKHNALVGSVNRTIVNQIADERNTSKMRRAFDAVSQFFKGLVSYYTHPPSMPIAEAQFSIATPENELMTQFASRHTISANKKSLSKQLNFGSIFSRKGTKDTIGRELLALINKNDATDKQQKLSEYKAYVETLALNADPKFLKCLDRLNTFEEHLDANNPNKYDRNLSLCATYATALETHTPFNFARQDTSIEAQLNAKLDQYQEHPSDSLKSEIETNLKEYQFSSYIDGIPLNADIQEKVRQSPFTLVETSDLEIRNAYDLKLLMSATKRSQREDKTRRFFKLYNRDVAPKLTKEMDTLEYLAIKIAYLNLEVDDTIYMGINMETQTRTESQYSNSYQVTDKHVCRDTGLVAYLLEPTSQDKNPIILFRGTASTLDKTAKIEGHTTGKKTDLDREGVGYNAYEQNSGTINKWIGEMIRGKPNRKVSVVGHSLGGALAQRTLCGSLHQNRLEVTTFQAPGIDKKTASLLEKGKIKDNTLVRKEASKDPCVKVGEVHLPATVFTMKSESNNPVKNHASTHGVNFALASSSSTGDWDNSTPTRLHQCADGRFRHDT